MLSKILGLFVGLAFALIVGMFVFAVSSNGLILTNLTCRLQVDSTYTCDIKEILWNTNFQLSEKQVEKVIDIKKASSWKCSKGCTFRVELQVVTGEYIPVRDAYSDSNSVQDLFIAVREKMMNKTEVIHYNSEINRFWDLYFPSSLAIFVSGIMAIAAIVKFFQGLRLRPGLA